MTTTPETQRDELEWALAAAYGGHPYAGTTRDHMAAKSLWSKGYRKPRTITTVEELDALPVGSILRLIGEDMPDDSAIKVRHELYDESIEHCWEISGSTENFTNAQMLDDAPDTVITVLWEPGV